jgi:DNA-directed RNA polymerase specialized sigma24 family protein
MKKSAATIENFELLLAWLDPDRDIAGEKYEIIHLKLTKIFARRGCNSPEELADKTIDRVMQKVVQVAQNYVGDPARYFYAVAKKIFLECMRPRPDVDPLPQIYYSEYKELRHACLEECLDELEADNKELILRYYQGEKESNIKQRKELADSLGITAETLRTRVQRIKNTLRKCVKDCLKKNE